jgi:Mn-dependent DtxR family transcriptional regulator
MAFLIGFFISCIFPFYNEVFIKLSNGKYIDYEKYAGITLTRKGREIVRKQKRNMIHSKNFYYSLALTKTLLMKMHVIWSIFCILIL